MNISFETEGPVAIVTIDRPEVRNCVDGPTALELAAAFRRFEDSDDLLVGVLTGSKGAFCAGADLKAVGSSRGNKVSEDGDGPMGPTRMLLLETPCKTTIQVVLVLRSRRLSVQALPFASQFGDRHLSKRVDLTDHAGLRWH